MTTDIVVPFAAARKFGSKSFNAVSIKKALVMSLALLNQKDPDCL
jgi:hypothetical protein